MAAKKSKRKKIISEFRRDLVCGEWILVSSLRRLKPNFFKKTARAKTHTPKSKCPFENPQKSGNPPPILWYPKKPGGSFDDWFIQVIPNRYPLLLDSTTCPKISSYSNYKKMEAIGLHEVIIMRDHNKPLQKMSIDELVIILKTYRQRYKILEQEKCVEYVLIFHNEGELAGASINHPHSQLVALPILPPDVARSINGALHFFENNNKCVHCTMIESEKKDKKRIIYQNKFFMTFCPYASKVPFETRIFPLKHNSDFEETKDDELYYLASSLKDALLRMDKVLKNPDYNFFIHTASSKVKDVPYYHWHLEIFPHIYKWAGLELGTGIEVVTVPPEDAAKLLRAVKL